MSVSLLKMFAKLNYPLQCNCILSHLKYIPVVSGCINLIDAYLHNEADGATSRFDQMNERERENKMSLIYIYI